MYTTTTIRGAKRWADRPECAVVFSGPGRRSGRAQSPQSHVQDLLYTWDAVGNVVQIQDDAQSVLYFANQAVAPIQVYEHDALYRLTGFWGRERTGDPGQGWDLPPVDTSFTSPSAPTNCEEHYSYDASGNLLSRQHSNGAGTWERGFTYDVASNRLLSSTLGATTESFTYTARGATDALPHLPAIVRDLRDQIRWVDLQVGPNPDTVRYLYDGAGQRVRTVARLGANTQVRSYVGRYEVWRKTVSAVLTEERTTLHVQDGTGRVAMLERKTVSGGNPVATPVNRWRFQLDNHLGTASVETTETGEIISYEEYHPYGTTSWWAQDSAIDVSSKRYRYTGMERDEHTGLQLHGARWYAPWLGRWTSADPIGIGDGANVYSYCGGRAIAARDPSGTQDLVGAPNDETHAPGTPIPKPPELNGIDEFTGAVYDIGLHHAGEARGALSKRVRLHYADGTSIEIDIRTIGDSESKGRVSRLDKTTGVPVPAILDAVTVPRLLDIKRQIDIVRDDYTTLFAAQAFVAVVFPLVSGTTGHAPNPPRESLQVSTSREVGPTLALGRKTADGDRGPDARSPRRPGPHITRIGSPAESSLRA